MPPFAISSIADLCLKSVATNIVRHGISYVEAPQHSDIYINYKKTQLLFSDCILKVIERIFRDEEATDVDHFVHFAEFLFEGKMDVDFNTYLLPSLKLLFNEYTSRVSLRLKLKILKQPIVPHQLFDALSWCTNLRSLALQSCQFATSQLFEGMVGQSLVEVDLLYGQSCTDLTFINILKNCPSLQVFKASGELITDKCLLSLCTNNKTLVNFRFCKSEGKCCSLGKSLTKLMLHGTVITKMGIACALQHLSSLQKFVDGGLWAPDFGLVTGKRKRSRCIFRVDYHFVPHGIFELYDASVLHGGLPPTLKLTSLVFDAFSWYQYSEIVRKCCPYMNAYVCCLGPLRTLCADLNEELETALWIRREYNIGMVTDLREILFCLNQRDVKQFYTDGRAIIVSADNDEDELNVPASVQNLEQIHIRTLICISAPVLHFFSKMLSHAYNVRSLSVSGRIAEKAFTDAMKVNAFNRLEEISFCYADLKKISVKPLIENGSNLKRIAHVSCSNAANFAKRHENLARKNNFSVVINEEEENLCYATIKYN